MPRLDHILVERGLVASRSRARDLIKRGRVRVNGIVCPKPSQSIQSHNVEVEDFPWVSRAGLKLEHALHDLPHLRVAGRICLDLGASTGGFTHVLLDQGATHVTAVDVGTDQLHPSLLDNPRLINRPQTDVRSLTPGDFDPLPDLLVCDLSFIALHKALGPALHLAPSGADLIALVKPQFEVGRAHLGSGGIVRHREVADQALIDFQSWLTGQGWKVYAKGLAAVAGGDGNQETWVAAKKV